MFLIVGLSVLGILSSFAVSCAHFWFGFPIGCLVCRSHQDTSFGHSAGDRATQWVLPPHQKLASDLSDRALGRMPHVFDHAPTSMLWCLAIGQAHATGGLPPHGSSARSEVAFALVHAIAEQLDLSEVAVGVSLSGTNAAVPEFHITMQLRDASCAAANGLLHALCMHKAVSVALPSGQRVTVPAYDYGAARSVRAKRVLVRSLDPLYSRLICPAHKKALLFTLPLLRWSRAASAYWGRRRCTRDQVFSAEEPSALLASLCRPSCKTIASRRLKYFGLRQERSGASSSRDFCPPFEETFGLQPTARRGQEELGRAKCSRGATSNYLHDHGDKSPLQAPPSTGGRRAGGQKLSLISRFLWDVAGS